MHESMHDAALSPAAAGIIYQLCTESSNPDKLPSLSVPFSGFAMAYPYVSIKNTHF